MAQDGPIDNKWRYEETPLEKLDRIKLDTAREPRFDQVDVGDIRAFVLWQDIKDLEEMINDWRPVSGELESFVDLLTPEDHEMVVWIHTGFDELVEILQRISESEVGPGKESINEFYHPPISTLGRYWAPYWLAFINRPGMLPWLMNHGHLDDSYTELALVPVTARVARYCARIEANQTIEAEMTLARGTGICMRGQVHDAAHFEICAGPREVERVQSALETLCSR